MKKISLVLAVLVVLLGGAAWWLFSSLDFVVKYAIESYGPDIAGVPVAVGKVRISAADGKGSLHDVVVGNPRGFSARESIRVGEITLAVDPATVTQNVVVIRELTVDSTDITYEMVRGTNNLEAIQRNIEAYIGQPGGSSTLGGGAGTHRGRKYIVDRLTLRSARIVLADPLLKGGGINFMLPDIALKNIGRRTGGASAAEIAKLVLGTIITRIAITAATSSEMIRKGIGGALDSLRDKYR